MTASRLTPSASWSSKATRLRGKDSTLRIHSWLPHRALNRSNGWTNNFEAREFGDDTTICRLQHTCRDQRDGVERVCDPLVSFRRSVCIGLEQEAILLLGVP